MNAKSITKNELVKLNAELAERNAALCARVSALETQLAATQTKAAGAGGQSAPCKDCEYASFKEATDNARRLAKWAAEKCPGKYVVSQIGNRVVCKLRAGYNTMKAA